jgi:hypothetical protein
MSVCGSDASVGGGRNWEHRKSKQNGPHILLLFVPKINILPFKEGKLLFKI